MGNKRYLKEKSYSLLEQKIALKLSYPSASCEYKNKKLTWRGKIKPTACSKEYNVLVEYMLFKSPDVWVIGDELEQLDNPKFPHKYRIDRENKRVKICLYRYQSEFSSKRLLANTIIPWTVEWLYFYEVWLVTGEWYGGGEHP